MKVCVERGVEYDWSDSDTLDIAECLDENIECGDTCHIGLWVSRHDSREESWDREAQAGTRN